MVMENWLLWALLLISFSLNLYFLIHRQRRNTETMEEVDGSNDRQHIISDDQQHIISDVQRHISSDDRQLISSDDSAEGYKHEVFLSFFGNDTRTKFTDHLHSYLEDLRIETFRDREKLYVGKKINDKLMEAIETSKITMPIFSKNYASSEWCLMEVTHMVKCVEINKEATMMCPIFYDVTPSQVRNQTGSFQEAFAKHEKKLGKKTVDEWREALGKVPETKGWERDETADGYEAVLVKEIATKLLMELKKKHVEVTEHLVGMDQHEAELMSLLDLDCNDVKIVGIVGMGGIGKTTIAKFIYNKLCDDQFHQRCSYLENVRENVKQSRGLDTLKKQLTSDILKMPSDGVQMNQRTFKGIKALIVLDDVGKESQLTRVIGNCNWFGRGSRIIVTTRNKSTFREQTGAKIYEPRFMNSENALSLFCKHAFRQNFPLEGYEDLSKKIVSKVAGLPLSLEVIGSLLSTETRDGWDQTLEILGEIMPDEIQKCLQISYDKLNPLQQKIFLDIACHSIESQKDQARSASYMWKDCEFYPVSGLNALVNLSLVKIDEHGRFKMHDQLRHLGREIVRKENPHNPGDRSRLWSPEEAKEVLHSGTGTKGVETLTLFDFQNFCISDIAFKGMSSLRYLDLSHASNLTGDFKGIFSNLRWFRWHSNSQITEITNFCLPKLVVLDLSESKILDGWEDLIQIKGATNLKVLDLSGCPKLTKTPDLSAFSNLERLNLERCSNLAEISPSIGYLKHLNYLNLKYCNKCCEEVLDNTSYESILKLPEFVWNLKSLVELHMQSLKVTRLSEAIGNLANLERLDASECRSLKELPESVGKLRSLRWLNISSTGVKRLPSEIGRLEKLEEMDANNCKSLEELPEAIGNLTNLQRLNLCLTAIKKLPAGIGKLRKLKSLDCGRSSLEGELPCGLWSVSTLRELILRNTRIISMVRADISCCSDLRVLDLGICPNIRLPSSELKLPPALERLVIPLTKESLDSVANLLKLAKLAFHLHEDTHLVKFPIDLGGLPQELKELKFKGFKNFASLPVKINNLPWLRALAIGCDEYDVLETGWLVLDCCGFLERLPDLPNTLEDIRIRNCLKLSNVDGLAGLTSLVDLHIENCPSLASLPDLSTLNDLMYLSIYVCENLRIIKGLETLARLERLRLLDCPCLEKLPHSYLESKFSWEDDNDETLVLENFGPDNDSWRKEWAWWERWGTDEELQDESEPESLGTNEESHDEFNLESWGPENKAKRKTMLHNFLNLHLD